MDLQSWMIDGHFDSFISFLKNHTNSFHLLTKHLTCCPVDDSSLVPIVSLTSLDSSGLGLGGEVDMEETESVDACALYT